MRLFIFFIIGCVVGVALEWAYGTLWDVVGTTPWVYPNSPFHYSSLEGAPLWGLGGLFALAVYKALNGKIKSLLWLPLLMALAAIWILLYSQVLHPS